MRNSMIVAAAAAVALLGACKKTGENTYEVERPTVGTTTDTVKTPDVDIVRDSVTVPTVDVRRDSTKVAVPKVQVKNP